MLKPLRRGTRRYLDYYTMGAYLREVVAPDKLNLEMKCSCCGTPAAWYEYTRHTYACHFVMGGGTIEELSRTMGHSSTAITEAHYVHLATDYYTSGARNCMTADFGTESVQLAVKLAVSKASKGGQKEG